MKLKELLAGLEILSSNVNLETEAAQVCYDSRQVKSGDLFVALSGYAVDGHRFIPQAMASGAAAVLCQVPPENGETPYVQVADSRRALAVAGANFFGHPAKDMTMVGVTGTNGKTTSTYLLKAVLEAQGKKVGLIGTNQNMIGEKALPTERTTPESFELQKLFAAMRDAGCTHVVMEVSSHALYLDRVYGVPYAVGVFTNLTQDHLDFHKTMEEYCDAKSILFRNCGTGVVNAGDPWTPRLLKGAACKVVTFSSGGGADLWPEDVLLAEDHVAFTAVHGGDRVPVRVNIPGRFMVDNALGVLGAALALGIPLEESAAVLARVPHVKGRVEVAPTPGKDYTVLIDYAHSPDSLVNVLATVKGFAKGRTIALFGCGGDRDKAKRPKMGRAAAETADLVVVTTDNPRTERPADIIADILPGLQGTGTPYEVIEDRVEAIHWAMDHAQAGDVIVLCGKGHETYQEVGHEKRHMDEREIVADYL
ncbi:MAG: UDP-N-acetylmuramoyl-L-alanyl-D-glutamate--2,6-diaminopimelate ligase [Oscillibacter sp.]|jgi:UDP-N-acetylmuramoyl-L-alanyl-D-glutamate--2,6-diaminopimelate ligase|uniref:UDP-N-acetylmuramoyl-L-alanyl-D-glutamate--2, 6-diaminopimelate ligase n=1 Tax=uncultured Oscillibacter sp. TaxID=876091 RepID=UPI00217477A8|nr:UDP-N-acetylmuramoyl-L-alanyl-D-glutamate--2,6-diaminopimelate ligase [uncultured Oscillibacter sp.]MCI9643597.1 UDP-N-acetylmuramoyl-L-alanyl-D-glutamate--2,6-diaminopimelate ligase [Oscillibacter sp.]